MTINLYLGAADRVREESSVSKRQAWIQSERDRVLQPGCVVTELTVHTANHGNSLMPTVTMYAAGLEQVQTFHRAHGHLRVPRRFITESGFALGGWISRRRLELKAGRLPAERKAQLDELGMVWQARCAHLVPAAHPHYSIERWPAHTT